MKKYSIYKPGFTLLELLLVMAILVTVALASREVYNGFAMGKNIDAVSKTVIFDLRTARSNAMSGQESNNWGIHFVNGASDYYEFFSSPGTYAHASTTVKTTTYLSGGLSFGTPSEGNNLDIIFTSLSGTSSSATVNITSSQDQKNITVNAEGLVN
ncbi:MAG: type II secretion system protein [Candidatus Falkowbacteria bacterium]|nr:MAG: type II secretion system protein [Candidatus Falkowbacteria bacterium]